MSEDESYYKSTPPTNKKVRNPFDRILIDKLHKPICSPGMCKIYKKKKKGPFRWEIDQACNLIPAEIVVCNSQFEPSPDPALERIAEEATERFFSQELVIPSPLEISKKTKPMLKTPVNANVNKSNFVYEPTTVMRDVSAQTVLTLPPQLPKELEKLLEPYYTFTQDQFLNNDYENADVSLRRKLFFEEHSDEEVPHYDSEQTDDEIHIEQRPTSSYEVHSPLVVSPDLSRDVVTKGMKRTFGTPIEKVRPKPRNKILEVEDPCFSPIEFLTPKNKNHASPASSITSTSISPVAKVSSDEEKNNFASPESDAMMTCLDSMSNVETLKKTPCTCKSTPEKSIILRRSTSLKDSPLRSRKVSFAEKRSLSMSSLHRSRSVQKLDFSMDMSIDQSLRDHSQADSESSPQDRDTPWVLKDENTIQNLVKADEMKQNMRITTKLHTEVYDLVETPVKNKMKNNILSYEVNNKNYCTSPFSMSLDNSADDSDDNPLHLEHKKIDFNNIDLKFVTDDVNKFEFNNRTKICDSSSSFKRIDSGYNENTFYANASSYYESSIKPSELTVTNVSKMDHNKAAFREISNIYWTRSDSGYKDENSADITNFYSTSDGKGKKPGNFQVAEARVEEKENVIKDDFDRFLQVSNKNEASMSMSDIITDDMTFNCNFSSTPSKSKPRKAHSSIIS